MRFQRNVPFAIVLTLLVLPACSRNAMGTDDDEDESPILNQTLTQADRMGLPAVNTAFVSADADKNAFNAGIPANDEAAFLGTLTETIMARYGLDAMQAGGLADFVLPDVLPLGDLSGFPNGRRLADDVIDVELGLIFGVFGPAVAPLQSDGVDENDRSFLPAFPYLATPQGG
jgi:hypothetical protein